MPKLIISGERARFHCPGCGCSHVIKIAGENAWGWNGSVDAPTITPSIRAYAGYSEGVQITVCHSYVTDGKIQFLGDSHHALAGQTVDLPEISRGVYDPD